MKICGNIKYCIIIFDDNVHVIYYYFADTELSIKRTSPLPPIGSASVACLGDCHVVLLIGLYFVYTNVYNYIYNIYIYIYVCLYKYCIYSQ